MNKTLITIVALSIDSKWAILYKEDGSTVKLQQGDARLPEVVKQAKEQKLGSGSKTAVVDITPIVAVRQEYEAAEKGTKGLVKFFRVAKSVISKLINTESPTEVPVEAAHVSPLEIGVKPGDKIPEPEPIIPVVPAPVVEPKADVPAELTNDQKVDAARERMDMLMGNGATTTDKAEFHTPLDESKETIVAVNTETGSVLPDAHKMSHQLRQFAKLQNYAGYSNFVKRLELVINDRGHSVEDLMKFIEKGDLPIADDGCIVIYKRLNTRDKNAGVYVDVHSGNIRQKVGSYVFMRPGLVDPNRRQDCSNGLHVASLSYLSSFSGGVTVIAKVRPEDVFAVPEYNVNKMRVCGYHILAVLDDKLRNLVNGGGSISSVPEGAALLHNILRGNHVNVIEHVEVGGHKGSNVTYTKVAEATIEQAIIAAGEAQTLEENKVDEVSVPVADPVKVTDLVEPKQKETPVVKVSKKAKAKKAKPVKAKAAAKVYTKSGAMLATFNGLKDAQTSDVAHELAQKILAMKSGAKKGWDKLGFTTDEVNFVMGSLRKQSNPKAEAMLEAQKKAEKRKESGRAKSGSPATLIRELLDQAPLNKAQYEAILLLKKKAKKGWAALGVTPSEQADIEQHTK